MDNNFIPWPRTKYKKVYWNGVNLENLYDQTEEIQIRFQIIGFEKTLLMLWKFKLYE